MTTTAALRVRTETVAPAEASRVPALDGVRGIAIGTVLVYHASVYWPAVRTSFVDRAVYALAQEGWIGVDLFFILSGFLITRILLRSRGKKTYFSTFYARRALRIFPLYYTLILVTCLLGRFVLEDRERFAPLWAAQGWLWLFSYNIEIFRVGHWFSSMDNCWSLAVEEQFYLVWPIVIASFAPRRVAVGALVAAVGCIVLRAWMAHSGFSVAQIYVITPARCDGLMLGGALAIAAHMKVARTTMVRLSLAAIALGAALRIAIALHLIGVGVSNEGWLTTAWTPMLAGAVALSTMSPNGAPLNRALGWGPLGFLGKYSYGIYLLHEPFFFFAQRPFAHVVVPFSATATLVLRLAIAMPIVAGVAIASFHFLETPFLRLKDRFR